MPGRPGTPLEIAAPPRSVGWFVRPPCAAAIASSAQPLRAGLLVCGLVLVAYLLRLYRIDARSLWIDEGYTAYLTGRSVGEIVRGAALDQHPPLYYLLLAGWQRLAGNSPFALRLLSAGIGTLSVPLLHRLSARLYGRTPALLAAAALTFAPFHVWYSQEARMYALLCLLAIASTEQLCRVIERPSGPRLLLYGALGAAMLYTQYYGLFVLAAHNLGFLLWRARAGWGSWVRWAAVQGAVGLAFAPWARTMVYQTFNHRMTWLGEPRSDDVVGAAAELVLGLRWIEGGLLGYAVSAVLVLACLAALRAGPRRAALMLAWIAAPMVGSLAVTRLLTPIFAPKHWLVALPALCILVGVFLAPLARHIRPATLVAGLMLLALPGLYFDAFVYEKQDWRGLVRYVIDHREPGDVLFLNPGASSTVVSYYLERYGVGEITVDGYPQAYDPALGPWAGEQATPARVRAKLDALTHSRGRVWFVQFSSAFWDPHGELAKQLRERSSSEEQLPIRGLAATLYTLRR